MTKFVVYQIEYGGDIDGTGPEHWRDMEIGRFDTEDEALDFVSTHWTDCEICEE